jgi:lysophospholipase
MPDRPVLVLLGDDELVVSPAAIRRVVSRMAQGQLVELPGGRHELLMERPAIRAAIWRQFDAFLVSTPTRTRRPRAAASGPEVDLRRRR